MPLTRRQVYRRRRVTVFGGLGLVLSMLVYLPYTLLAPLEPAEARVHPYLAPQAPVAAVDWPDYGASAIGLIDGSEPLAEAGTDDSMPIASIAKLVTVLVCLERLPLRPGETGPSLSMTSEDVARYSAYQARDAKVIPTRAGARFNQFEVLQVVLLESANNYADALAIWAYGSVEAYLGAAAEWLAEHRLTETTVVDATGLSAENRSTGSDLLEIGRLAHAHPVVREIAGTPSVQMHDAGPLENTNPLVATGELTGLKTGTLRAHGRNLLFTAERLVGEERLVLVGVVLGAPDEPTLLRDVVRLTESTVAGFHDLPLTEKGQRYATLTSEWGERADAVSGAAESVLVWSDVPVTVLVSTASVVTGRVGERIGDVTFSVAGRTVRVPLLLNRTLSDPGPWWRLTHPFELS